MKGEEGNQRTTNSCRIHADLSPLRAVTSLPPPTTSHQPVAMCMERPAPKCWRNKSALTQTKLTPSSLFLNLSFFPCLCHTNLSCCPDCKHRRRCLSVLLCLVLSGASLAFEGQFRLSPQSHEE